MLTALLQNTPLICALVAMGSAQVIKVAIVLLTERRLALDRLLETGGMPSSHSAAVVGLGTAIGMIHGWDSPWFAVTAVFGTIVMYDAAGIRRAAGIHAGLLNDLVRELNHLFDEGFQPQALKTLLGHTYPQVFVGAIVGLVTALILAA